MINLKCTDVHYANLNSRLTLCQHKQGFFKLWAVECAISVSCLCLF